MRVDDRDLLWGFCDGCRTHLQYLKVV
ncbi:MAG: hypothetical protein EAS48_10780 [Chryseobacterium sp.]|nr:MAG: hypothetical protein EAS48_10780 [Chryseobacterium sp.]